MIRLYMDEDSEKRSLTRALRARGIDVLTAREAGMNGRKDPEQLAFAASVARSIVTANQGDFMRLHWQWLSRDEHHAGIIVIVQSRYGIGEQLRRLERLAIGRTADEMLNRLEFLNDWGEERGRS